MKKFNILLIYFYIHKIEYYNILKSMGKVAKVCDNIDKKDIDIVNKCIPVIKNDGNSIFDIEGKIIDVKDKLKDNIIDIPFKPIRKVQEICNNYLNNELYDKIMKIENIEIKSNFKNKIYCNTYRISNLESIVLNHDKKISYSESKVSNDGMKISCLERNIDLYSRQIKNINYNLNKNN